VVLDLDRKTLVVRIERWPARHGPGLEDAIELEPEIVKHPSRVVALDDEAQPRGRRHRLLPGRFVRPGEIPLGAMYRYAGFRRACLGQLFPRFTQGIDVGPSGTFP